MRISSCPHSFRRFYLHILFIYLFFFKYVIFLSFRVHVFAARREFNHHGLGMNKKNLSISLRELFKEENKIFFRSRQRKNREKKKAQYVHSLVILPVRNIEII